MGDIRALARQVTLVGSAIIAYLAVRVVVAGSGSSPFRNARSILSTESVLGLDWERAFQAWLMPRGPIVHTLNIAYTWCYWPIVLGTLAFTWWRSKPLYRRYRMALLLSGAVGVVIFATFPVAPPRMIGGFVDTLGAGRTSSFLARPSYLINPFAAMPSFHAGWVALACIVQASMARSALARVSLLVPAVVMALAVVGTGNHYVVDVVGGVGLSLLAYMLSPYASRSSVFRRVFGRAQQANGVARDDKGRPRSHA